VPVLAEVEGLAEGLCGSYDLSAQVRPVIWASAPRVAQLPRGLFIPGRIYVLPCSLLSRQLSSTPIFMANRSTFITKDLAGIHKAARDQGRAHARGKGGLVR
jgi:hypothetical protein